MESEPWKVLIVDDSEIFREVLIHALRSRFPSIEVLEAGDLTEGYQKIRKHKPDLIILDISLPDGNGLDLARRVHQELPAAIVAMCTTYDIREYREASARCGAAHFLAKQNMDWEWLDRTVANEIDRRQHATAC